MHVLATYESTPTFDPYNPNQLTATPNNIWNPNGGQYTTYYWNKVPTKTRQVLGGGLGSSLPVWLQALVVGGLAAGVGYLGVRYVGPKVGLSGPRRDRHGRFI